MSTDISLYVEKNNYRDHQWYHIANAPIYDCQEYLLFSLLANVRNYSDVIPISEPKGLPNDASPKVKKAYDHEATIFPVHGESFLTLQEILSYDWNRVNNYSAVVSKEEYKIFKKDGEPNTYCQGTVGAKVRMVTHEEMDTIIFNEASEKTEFHYYTVATWPIKYKDFSPWFTQELIPYLKGFGDPKSIRIVFWFDCP